MPVVRTFPGEASWWIEAVQSEPKATQYKFDSALSRQVAQDTDWLGKRQSSLERSRRNQGAFDASTKEG
mgnify:CR=1 FL=1